MFKKDSKRAPLPHFWEQLAVAQQYLAVEKSSTNLVGLTKKKQ